MAETTVDKRPSAAADSLLVTAQRWLGRSPWLSYIVGRLLQGLVVVIGAIVISFLLIHATGNPATVLSGGALSPEQVRKLSEQLGYERPLLVQFAEYMGNVARGNLGNSFRFNEPAAGIVLKAFPSTLLLIGLAILVATLVAIGAAVLSVLHRESLLDRTLRRALIVGQGIPEFWLGLALALVFAVWLRLLPSMGMSDWRSLVLPVFTLALPLSSMLTRLLRAELLDTLNLDYVLALRAKGLTDWEILRHHALLNALIPFITYLALQIGWLVGGTIVVEAVFVWPGIGTVALTAVKSRDLTILQALVILVAVAYVLFNLLADLVVMLLDPRLRVGRS